jgi:mono/diheme cytochrome c family protein
MPRIVLNVVLAALLAGSLALAWGIHRDPTTPNYRFIMQDMADSIPSDAQSPNALLPGGRTAQLPIEGTIARGRAPLRYAKPTGEGARPGLELINPLRKAAAEDSEVLAGFVSEGQQAFRIYCFPCHGGGGKGDGPVAQRGYPPPASLLAEPAINRTDGEIYHIIADGLGNMPAYGNLVAPETRWRIVLYIRSLQEAAKANSGDNAP